MPSSTIRNIAATWVRSGTPKKNLSAEKRIVIRATGGEAGIGLMTASLPAPRGAVYKSVKLKMWNSSAMPGSNNVYVNRITGGWNVSKVTWDTRPAWTTTGRVGVGKTDAAKNTLWEFDLTAMFNSASNGTNLWAGFALTSGAASVWQYFYHPGASATYGPVLEVEWYENPMEPTLLNPRDAQAVSVALPTLQCDFVDLVGATTMKAIQVQIHTSNTFGSPMWDSGTVLTDNPELDLADSSLVPSPPTLTPGTTYWWRVRVMDSTDLWSPWSLGEDFKRVAKGTVTINSPGAAPNNFIEETTPPVLWSVSGLTQTAYQVLVWNGEKTALLLDTGRVTGTDDSVTLDSWLPWYNKALGNASSGASSPFNNDESYVLELRIWDNVTRATTPGDPDYVVAERVFTYKETATVSPVTSIVLEQVLSHPFAQILVERATAPDLFSLWRDGVCIADKLDPSNYDIGGGQYRFTDRRATPRTPHKWQVKAIVNGKTSTANPEATGQTKPQTAFLARWDGSWVVPLFNYTPTIGTLDGSSTTTVMNSDEAITVYQGGDGREGDFSGVISGAITSKTSQQNLAHILSMKAPENKGLPCVLTYADQLIVCSISQINSAPTVYSEEICYAVSFHLTERRP